MFRSTHVYHQKNPCLAPVFGADEFDGRGAITSPCSVEGSCHIYRIGTDGDLVSTSIDRTRRGESETSAEVPRWFAQSLFVYNTWYLYLILNYKIDKTYLKERKNMLYIGILQGFTLLQTSLARFEFHRISILVVQPINSIQFPASALLPGMAFV